MFVLGMPLYVNCARDAGASVGQLGGSERVEGSGIV